MVQSNSSERVQKNNGNYAKFPIPSMWYKKGLSSDYVISVERISHGTPRVLHSYKCLRFQMLCITCSTVSLLPCILSRSKFFWRSVTRFLMDYVIRCINFDISCVQSIATLHDIRSLSSINKDGRSRNRKTSLSVSLTK